MSVCSPRDSPMRSHGTIPWYDPMEGIELQSGRSTAAGGAMRYYSALLGGEFTARPNSTY